MNGTGGQWRELAPAKINLALHVTGRRDDGYHDLDTIVVFADFGDELIFVPADTLQLAVAGPFAGHALGTANNLAYRAAGALRDAASVGYGAAIELHKNIPAGAGLGGGSADAAAVLRGLNRMWDLGLSADRLATIGAPLGADVPMCVHAHPLRATGTGASITEIPVMPPLPLLVVWPGVKVGTSGIFGSLGPVTGPQLPELPELPLKWRTSADVADWLSRAGNDLQAPAVNLAPEIATVLETLHAAPECQVARMTGSGSACFGLFATIEAARHAGAAIAVSQPHWWVRSSFNARSPA